VEPEVAVDFDAEKALLQFDMSSLDMTLPVSSINLNRLGL